MARQTPFHITAMDFAVRHKFRLRRDDQRRYWLVDENEERIAAPAYGETTAAGAIRMMRHHLFYRFKEGRIT